MESIAWMAWTLPTAIFFALLACRLIVMTWFGVACELHRDWRNDIEGLATLFSNHLPSYRCLIYSYNMKQK